ncbi:MAG: hypothetical protein HKM04_10245 [Legionellales bacterium]|nr:hypothetical protein [Legionellales bacterium]
MPSTVLKTWIAEEKQAGANDPQQAILLTVTDEGTPHAGMKITGQNNYYPHKTRSTI